jgi:hypothetical protein
VAHQRERNVENERANLPISGGRKEGFMIDGKNGLLPLLTFDTADRGNEL